MLFCLLISTQAYVPCLASKFRLIHISQDTALVLQHLAPWSELHDEHPAASNSLVSKPPWANVLHGFWVSSEESSCQAFVCEPRRRVSCTLIRKSSRLMTAPTECGRTNWSVPFQHVCIKFIPAIGAIKLNPFIKSQSYRKPHLVTSWIIQALWSHLLVSFLIGA